jgi:hypothetical protein
MNYIIALLSAIFGVEAVRAGIPSWVVLIMMLVMVAFCENRSAPPQDGA